MGTCTAISFALPGRLKKSGADIVVCACGSWKASLPGVIANARHGMQAGVGIQPLNPAGYIDEALEQGRWWWPTRRPAYAGQPLTPMGGKEDIRDKLITRGLQTEVAADGLLPRRLPAFFRRVQPLPSAAYQLFKPGLTGGWGQAIKGIDQAMAYNHAIYGG
jgi:hypothetical protein